MKRKEKIHLSKLFKISFRSFEKNYVIIFLFKQKISRNLKIAVRFEPEKNRKIVRIIVQNLMHVNVLKRSLSRTNIKKVRFVRIKCVRIIESRVYIKKREIIAEL